MTRELILCIPGPWQDRPEFLRQLITSEPIGRFMFAGAILADVAAKDHVPLEFCPADPQMANAFEIAGQGKLPSNLLDAIAGHRSVLYLHFPLDLPSHRERMLHFTDLLRRMGGLAVKVESAGVAHTWERWFSLLKGSSFQHYCAVVVLIGGDDYYYSCGMHHFGLPECAVPRSVPVAEAADLMNRFNDYQITETPALATGHTFSLSDSAPKFRLTLEADSLHASDDLFHNAHGVWRLDAA